MRGHSYLQLWREQRWRGCSFGPWKHRRDHQGDPGPWRGRVSEGTDVHVYAGVGGWG